MRVLYLSQYYPPELGATQSRAQAMARGLVRAGHAVTVLTEIPNHPEGVVHPAYRNRGTVREVDEGIEVIHLPVWTSERKDAFRRVRFYASYALRAWWAGVRDPERVDVVFATSPPLFTAAAGRWIAAARRVPFVMEVRDAWPESAVQLGELRSGRVVAAARRMERSALRHASRVITVTEGLRHRLVADGLPADRVVTIPNGADTARFRPDGEDRRALRARLGLPAEAFVVLYAGLHGLAHGLEIVLDAAERLQDDAAVRFVFIGAGPRKAALGEQSRRRSLRNVEFHDAMPEEQLADWIRAADVGLDTRRRLPISREALPVKMFAAMATARPVLLAIEGEAAELVQREGAGLVVPPEDPDALADAVLRLRGDPEACRTMGERGRRLVERSYDRAALAERLVKVLEESCAPSAQE